MLGWDITVYRQLIDATGPATLFSERGSMVASWSAEWDGLRWIDALAASGAAEHLGGNGYPFTYTARAAKLLAQIVAGPPQVKTRLTFVAGGVESATHHPVCELHHDVIATCIQDEWVLIIAWDQS